MSFHGENRKLQSIFWRVLDDVLCILDKIERRKKNTFNNVVLKKLSQEGFL